MDFHSIKGELRGLGIRILFEMVMNQREFKCLIMNGPCPFYFKHKGYGFCLSEVLGKGCEWQQMEKLEGEISKTYTARNLPLMLSILSEDPRVLLT